MSTTPDPNVSETMERERLDLLSTKLAARADYLAEEDELYVDGATIALLREAAAALRALPVQQDADTIDGTAFKDVMCANSRTVLPVQQERERLWEVIRDAVWGGRKYPEMNDGDLADAGCNRFFGRRHVPLEERKDPPKAKQSWLP